VAEALLSCVLLLPEGQQAWLASAAAKSRICALLSLGVTLISVRCDGSVKLFPTHFKQLYPGHPNLDSYIFGGGSGNSAPDAAALQQVKICLCNDMCAIYTCFTQRHVCLSVFLCTSVGRLVFVPVN